LACILVVAYHVIGSGPGSGLGLPENSWLRQASDALALIRMPLFTFLSGYLFSVRPVIAGQYSRFLRKKLLRLYVPAIVVGLLYFALSSLAPGVNGRPDLLEPLKLLVYPYVHYWFVQALIVILVLVGLAETQGLLATRNRFVMVLLATIVIQLFGTREIHIFSLSGAEYLAPFFVMGIGMHRYASSIRWNASFSALVAGIFGITLSIHTAGVFGVFGAPLKICTFLSLLLSASGLLVLCRVFPVVRALAYIGQFSFTIYLFHVFFTAGMRTFAHAAGLDATVALLGLGMLAGICGPIFVDLFVKRMPNPFPICLLGIPVKRLELTAR